MSTQTTSRGGVFLLGAVTGAVVGLALGGLTTVEALLDRGNVVTAGKLAMGGLQGALWGMVVGSALSVLWYWLDLGIYPLRAWRLWIDGLARLARLLLALAVAVGLLAGTAVVLAWRRGAHLPYPAYESQVALLLVAVFLGLPSLLAAVYDLRSRPHEARGRLLAFVGPLLVFIVGEGLTPHLDEPWHQLGHTLMGGLPLTLLYWFAFRRWHPSVVSASRTPKVAN
ncbi:MAG: complement resistance protein TraT [Chloroflexota bacterium]|nr:complement resistance protein TraT [Chloroflexota bacterium]